MARRAAAAGLLLALSAGALTRSPDPLWAMAGPATGLVVAAVLLATWPGGRRWTAPAAAAVAGVTLAVTGCVAAVEPMPRQPPIPTMLWILLEMGTLAAFAYLPVRWARPLHATWSAGLAVCAAALIVLRFDLAWSLWSAVTVCGLWALPAVVAGLMAAYLRNLESAGRRAVREARQLQRLELAGDLHDFVAHDLSEIVAQAQAGAVVLADRDPAVNELLRRIEAAGLRSLASMDRTIDMLHEDTRAPVGLLADVPRLLRTYRTAAGGEITLELDPGIADLPREVSAVAYRVVVESLTNVRRHAATAGRVTVAARCLTGELRLSVIDDGRGGGRSARARSAGGGRSGRSGRSTRSTRSGRSGSGGRGGRGLAGLAARVEALGGVFRAGALDGVGWRVEASLPIEVPT